MTEHPEKFKQTLEMTMQKVKFKPNAVNAINLGNFDVYSVLNATMTDVECAATIIAAKSLNLFLKIGTDKMNSMTPEEILTEVSGGILN